MYWSSMKIVDINVVYLGLSMFFFRKTLQMVNLLIMQRFMFYIFYLPFVVFSSKLLYNDTIHVHFSRITSRSTLFAIITFKALYT